MSTSLNNCYLVKVSAKGEKGGQKYQKISTQTKQHSPRIYPHIIRRFQRFGSMLSIISLSGENVLYESNIELFFLTSSRIYHFQLIEQMDTQNLFRESDSTQPSKPIGHSDAKNTLWQFCHLLNSPVYIQRKTSAQRHDVTWKQKTKYRKSVHSLVK